MKKLIILFAFSLVSCHTLHRVTNDQSHEQKNTVSTRDTSTLQQAVQTKHIDSTRTTTTDTGIKRTTEHVHIVTDAKTGLTTTDIDRSIEDRANRRTDEQKAVHNDDSKQKQQSTGHRQQKKKTVKDTHNQGDTTVKPSYGWIIWLAGALILVVVAVWAYRRYF